MKTLFQKGTLRIAVALTRERSLQPFYRWPGR
jgi:hypothetical protein